MWIRYRCQSRIGNYYQHDGEQFGFYKKSTYENTEQKEACSCNFTLQVNETKNKKQSILIGLTKNHTQRQMPYSAWRKLTWINRNWTGKLQITEAPTGSLL